MASNPGDAALLHASFVPSPSATANIVLIGAGWWSQGWHLPHLHRNERVKIAAIVDSSPHPKSTLNPNLEPLSTLATRYNCPVYNSLSSLLQDPNVGPTIDGAIVCTPHSTHYNIGKELIAEGRRRYEEAKKGGGGDAGGGEEVKYRPINILMEKPMTTNVREARELQDLLMDCRRCEEADRKESSSNSASSASKPPTAMMNSLALISGEHIKTTRNNIGGGIGCFLINHSANYRPQARSARSIVDSGKLGKIRHVSAFFASPLSWIFDNPANVGWNVPDEADGDMVGNGFAWGQSSHLLGWIYHVCGEELVPMKVFCAMTTSEHTGADVSHAATVVCRNGATFSLSGTSLLPGYEHSDPPVAKRVWIKIFGERGALFFSGNDQDSKSGKLEWLREEDKGGGGGQSTVEIQCPELGFQFEELDQGGIGPGSMQCFIDACLGREDYYVGADVGVGLKSVQTIDAMYRSHVSGDCVTVKE